MGCNSRIKRASIAAAGFFSTFFLVACGPEGPPPPRDYVYSCATCHEDGLGGAPVTGDRDEWERRIAKGVAKVRSNALEGFEGGTGIMPAKGGNLDLSDEQVIALVDYMIEASR